ncbi:hypothetical protein [Microbacterium abyssi]|nr:hypothetical protein [Microbacterium sp. A18JL241]
MSHEPRDDAKHGQKPDDQVKQDKPLPEDTDAPDPERAFRHEMPDGSEHD